MSNYQLKIHVEKPGTTYTDPKNGTVHPSFEGCGNTHYSSRR